MCHAKEPNPTDPNTSDDDWDDPNHRLFSMKYDCDGIKTLEELATRLEALAAHYRDLKREGWEMQQEVDGAWVDLRRHVSPADLADPADPSDA